MSTSKYHTLESMAVMLLSVSCLNLNNYFLTMNYYDSHIGAASWQNKQNGMCAQRKLRSAWASAQSDQSLRCVLSGPKGPKLSSCGQRRLWSDCADAQADLRLWSDWADAQADLSLRWAHMPFCWFCHEAAHMILSGRCKYSSVMIFCWFRQNEWSRINKTYLVC